MQNSAHKRFLQKFKKKLPKSAAKNFARVLFAFILRERARRPQITLNTSPATLNQGDWNNAILDFVCKHPFYEVNPRQKPKHKKWKTSSTVREISKLKSRKKMQNLAHKRFLQKFGGNSQKALKKFRESVVCIRMAWETALTTHNAK